MPLPPVRLHDTRHGAASLALAAWVDVTIVSADCGHATTAFTRDVHQHVLPELACAAAEATADIVPRNGRFRNTVRQDAHTTPSSADETDQTDRVFVNEIPGQGWWGESGSNRRPAGYESAALTN